MTEKPKTPRRKITFDTPRIGDESPVSKCVKRPTINDLLQTFDQLTPEQQDKALSALQTRVFRRRATRR